MRMLLFTAISLLSFSLNLKAEIIHGDIKLEMTQAEDQFVRSEADSLLFIQSKHRSETRVQASLFSKSRGFREETELIELDYVPGKDDGGRGKSEMKLLESDGKFFVELNSILIVSNEPSNDLKDIFVRNPDLLKDPKQIREIKQTARYEIEFTKGSFSAFKNGQMCEWRLKTSSLEQFLIDTRNQIDAELIRKLEVFRDPQLGEKISGTISIQLSEKSAQKRNIQFRGTGDEIFVEWPPFTVEAKFKIQ